MKMNRRGVVAAVMGGLAAAGIIGRNKLFGSKDNKESTNEQKKTEDK